jgi:hypothetical protein
MDIHSYMPEGKLGYYLQEAVRFFLYRASGPGLQKKLGGPTQYKQAESCQPAAAGS